MNSSPSSTRTATAVSSADAPPHARPRFHPAALVPFPFAPRFDWERQRRPRRSVPSHTDSPHSGPNPCESHHTFPIAGGGHFSMITMRGHHLPHTCTAAEEEGDTGANLLARPAFRDPSLAGGRERPAQIRIRLQRRALHHLAQTIAHHQPRGLPSRFQRLGSASSAHWPSMRERGGLDSSTA
jgi:hypothetical protein